MLLALDYDGTLAPIVARPEAAAPHPRALSLLSELSHKVLLLAVVSGRDTDFLADQLPLPNVLLIGNHGLEERRGGDSQVVDEARSYAGALRRAAGALQAVEALRTPGTIVEQKRATLTVHYRQWADPGSASVRLRPKMAAIARDTGLWLQDGRFVYELRPPLPVDKGSVLRRLIERAHPRSVLFAGDDRTDVDALRELGRLRSPALQTIGVAVRSDETPADLLEEADLVVDGVEGVMEMLDAVRGRLGA